MLLRFTDSTSSRVLKVRRSEMKWQPPLLIRSEFNQKVPEVRGNAGVDHTAPVTPGGRGTWTLTGCRKSELGFWERQRRGLTWA